MILFENGVNNKILKFIFENVMCFTQSYGKLLIFFLFNLFILMDVAEWVFFYLALLTKFIGMETVEEFK